MRVFLIVISICLNIDFGYSQAKEHIIIPHLKEDKKIDSLIDIILKSKAYHSRVKLANECFLTGTLIKRNDNSLYLSLYIDSAQSANRFTNRMNRHYGNLGCFNYKGIYVILWSPDKFIGLFSNTGEFKVYGDIYKLTGNDLLNDSLGRKSWSYVYKNKRFVKDND
jgi:hypothetical protein